MLCNQPMKSQAVNRPPKRGNSGLSCRAFWIVLILLFVLSPFGTAWAKPVTGSQVQQVVGNWLSLEALPLGAAISWQIRGITPYPDPSGNVMYFIVYLEPKGLVIVPGDDLVEPIVGFVTDAVSYDPSDDNPLGALVSKDVPGRVLAAREQESKAQVQGIETMDVVSTAAQAKWRLLEGNAYSERTTEGKLASISDIRVAPLIQSKWSQDTVAGSNCYNYYTPNNYPCGCVATAMSQLMRYHSYPTTGVGSSSFSIKVDNVTQTKSLRGGNGSGGAYNWSSMMLVPDATMTTAQRQAIGALTYDAGVSVNMEYTSSSSATDTLKAATAYVSTFGYSNGKNGYNSGSNFPTTQRNNMVNPNLDASYPVLFGITGTSGGHSIVGDGYGYNASTLYHHLNMGWSGANDAWYNLPTIDDSYYGFNSVYKVVYNVFTSGTGEIISGRVSDSSGNPLSGVTVNATRSGGGSYTAATNAQGIYALAKIPSASTYTLTASKSGYTFSPLTVSIGTSTDSTTTTGNYWGANFSPSGTSCTYTISPTTASVSAAGGTGAVTVTAASGCSWTALSNVSWITVTSGSSGSGNGTVGYSVAANATGSARTGTMTIAGQTFTVAQNGSLDLGSALDNTSLVWTTGGNAPFTSQTTTYYYGGSAAQTGSIGDNQSTYLSTSVTGPGTLSFSWKVSSEEDFDFFNVYLDGVLKYYWSGESSWFRSELTIPSGTHTVKWEYVKDADVSSGQDAGWVDDVVFTPATSCTCTLTPTSFSFSASGSTGTVSVTTSSSSCSWSATSNNTSWITITAGSSGTGNGTVGYSVSANATGSARTGTMTIGGQTFTVTQNGATSCTYTLTPTSFSFSASGSTGTVAVTTSSSSCSWSATSNNTSWITITAGSSGTGNGTVFYSVSANATGSARTGTMTIGGQTFTVTQNGATSCTYTLTPTSSSFSASSNTGTVSVTTSSGSCFWSATSNVSWITITGWGSGSGTGNGTVGYSVSANATGSARTGTMTIGGQTFTVTQNGATSCTYTLTPTSSLFSFSGNTGTVSVTTSLSSCPWNATSNNPSWITITAGSAGTGDGMVGYSISANTAGSTRTGTMTIGGQTFTVTQYGVYIPPGANATLYFPHVDTTFGWQTEIAVINTGDQTVTGTLTGVGDVGQPIGTMNVTLSARGRRQINVANEFTNPADIKYIIFDTNSAAVQGYTKFYIPGAYRAAIPVVKEVNTSDIYIPHIDSGAQWWTGVSLVNTTAATKDLTIAFNTGQSRQITLNAYGHKAFTIAELVSDQPWTDIQSAVITNASGVIGLELFGNNGDGKQLEGILLTDDTSSTLYYPHVLGNGWWTGIVAYNTAWYDGYITIKPYDAQGNPLSTTFQSLLAKHKYVGTVSQLDLPAETAWFKIDSTGLPLTGFELLGTNDYNQLAAYAGGGGSGTKAGVFSKIEKNGWTDIALVNTEDNAASVTLTAYNDNGTPVATPSTFSVGGHAKVVNSAQAFFSQDISGATYIAYSSNRNVVGFQLNGSSDGTMLDGLPGLAGTN
jgi:hypothetical protein